MIMKGAGELMERRILISLNINLQIMYGLFTFVQAEHSRNSSQ